MSAIKQQFAIEFAGTTKVFNTIEEAEAFEKSSEDLVKVYSFLGDVLEMKKSNAYNLLADRLLGFSKFLKGEEIENLEDLKPKKAPVKTPAPTDNGDTFTGEGEAEVVDFEAKYKELSKEELEATVATCSEILDPAEIEYIQGLILSMEA